MPQGSTTLHESEEHLSPATRDMHRAIVSLMEELEAVDWYQQRMDATESGELRDILRHNRDEEKEHAAMVFEWIRRHDPAFDTKTVVTMTLTPTGKGTHLRVEQAGFRKEQKQAHGGARAGWTRFLGNLEQVLTKVN